MDQRKHRRQRAERTRELCRDDPALQARLQDVLRFSSRVRVSEYHVTNACNIRCEGCWFFAYGHDAATRDNRDLARLEDFLAKERRVRRVNAALVIGGEPTLVPDRLRVFRGAMRYLTISTNGLRALPRDGFEDVAVGITLFGGGPLDDRLRGIKPGGARFEGLFDRALENYRNDPRAGFVFALTEDGVEHIEPTVRRIRDNGNRVTFNFYSRYGTDDPVAEHDRGELLREALRVRELYPDVVMSHPQFIRAMITGRSHRARFGYDVCPSVSVDHPAHRGRIANGNPVLPFFNTWASDLRTLKSCCTSGRCNGCRDSQAVHSWLLVSLDHFLDSRASLRTWVELSEDYWSQFIWSPFHPARRAEAPRSIQAVAREAA